MVSYRSSIKGHFPAVFLEIFAWRDRRRDRIRLRSRLIISRKIASISSDFERAKRIG